jgi:hypothetical protein
MKTLWRAALVCLLMCLWAGAGGEALAAPRNDMPSCRQIFFNEAPQSFAQRDYLIIFDRTVVFPKAGIADIIKRTVESVHAGDHVQLFSLSSLTASEFIKEHLDLWFDVPASQSDLETKIPASKISLAQRCFGNQLSLGKMKLTTQLQSLMDAPLADALQSEILNALSSISRESMAQSKRDKRILVLSDMLENSDVINFYHPLLPGNVQTALDNAKANELLGRFEGAHIYVRGAAMVVEGHKPMSTKARALLRHFWEKWIQISGGELVSWGQGEEWPKDVN